ncbi:hypothetical protein B0H13DRAFT_2393775 [Mycena leptocephala]|nr:hypothetical protein B0H13DRAFT_2393775 [Mycena leptocephala]
MPEFNTAQHVDESTSQFWSDPNFNFTALTGTSQLDIPDVSHSFPAPDFGGVDFFDPNIFMASPDFFPCTSADYLPLLPAPPPDSPPAPPPVLDNASGPGTSAPKPRRTRNEVNANIITTSRSRAPSGALERKRMAEDNAEEAKRSKKARKVQFIIPLSVPKSLTIHSQ